MNPKGEIVMSRVTYERLGGPAAFHILFDEANNRIGLKPTVLAMKDAYAACKTGSHGGRAVSAYRLTQDYNIRLLETIRFHDAEIDYDGILILDLRTARISQRALKHPRNRAKLEKPREAIPAEPDPV